MLFKIIQTINAVWKANNNKTILVSQLSTNPKYPSYLAHDLEIKEVAGFDAGTNNRIEKAVLQILGYNETPLDRDQEFQSALDILEQTGVGYRNRLDQINGHWKVLFPASLLRFLSLEVESRGESLDPGTIAGIVNPFVSSARVGMLYQVSW